MKKNELLAASIVDAIELKNVAIANAKANLSESFDDVLKNILQAKLDEDANELDETEDSDDESADTGDTEDTNEVKSKDADEDDDASKEDENDEDDEMSEDIDIDAILAEMTDDEDEDEDDKEDAKKPVEDDDASVDEEIDINQLLSEFEDVNETKEDEDEDTTDEDEDDEDEDETDAPKKESLDTVSLMEQVRILTKTVNETNTLNAKLLYFNKLVSEVSDLNTKDRVKIVGAFDKAGSKKEAKLVYDTLKEAYATRKKVASKNSLKESLGFSSKSVGNSGKVSNSKKETIVENSAFSRMQELAGRALRD